MRTEIYRDIDQCEKEIMQYETTLKHVHNEELITQINKLIEGLKETILDCKMSQKDNNIAIEESRLNLQQYVKSQSFYHRGRNRTYSIKTQIEGLKHSRNLIDGIIKRLIKQQKAIFQ